MNVEDQEKRLQEIRVRAKQIMEACHNHAQGPAVGLAGSDEGIALQAELDQLRVEYAELQKGFPRMVGIL